jgi:hypothetical protein
MGHAGGTKCTSMLVIDMEKCVDTDTSEFIQNRSRTMAANPKPNAARSLAACFANPLQQ